MRITCPHCGNRSVAEFVAMGPAGLQRPAPDASAEAWVDYVYTRDNPAGAHRELFYHASGCRAWLVVERDTRTHLITSVKAARP